MIQVRTTRSARDPSEGAGGGEIESSPRVAGRDERPGTQDKTDAELHWIIKEGLAFTGMPGYGARMDDQRTWSLVAYLRTLEPQP